MIKSSHSIEQSSLLLMEDALYELAPSNWIVIDSHTDDSAKLVGFFDSENEAVIAQQELEFVLGKDFAKPFKLDQLEDEDWKESYKTHFKAWSRGTIHWVPEWERESYNVPCGNHALYVDPGMAFGTGNHETTRLCLESMISICDKKKVEDCLDVGCGSGILSLSAHLLVIGSVKGIDFDPDAITVARSNATLNKMESDVDYKVSSLEKLDAKDQFDLVLANIQADVLMQNAETLIQLVREDGFLVLSGILTSEMELVEDCFLNLLQKKETKIENDKKNSGEWSLLQLKLNA